jgi:hypothetical protein
MAIALYFAPASMTQEQYDETIRRLEQAGAGSPKGRTYHACFGSGSKLQVFDIWESMDDFEAFGKTLQPILQDVGIDAGQPMVEEVHNVIT